MKTTLLIDGDSIAYRAAFVAQGKSESPRPLACRMVQKLIGQLKADRAVVALSDPSRVYFRHALWPAYKPQRAEQPQHLHDAIAGFEDDVRVKIKYVPTLEADDVLGILATHAKFEGRKIIVSQDKDLLTIPGEHHQPGKTKDGQTFKVQRAEAEARHLMQTLMGCSSDGYPGCPGIGEARAQNIVGILDYCDSPAGVWRAVADTFIERGKTEADAILQARLARICRASDIDWDTMDVIPWEPPSAEYSVLLTVREPAPASHPPAAAVPVPTSLFTNDAAPAAQSGWPR